MTIAVNFPELGTPLPDHTQLPDSDGTFVGNFQEPAQADLLTLALSPVLARLHPDGRYCIGRDCGIYWRMIEPPERGAIAPDWFYVPQVERMAEGQYRRSYVLWQEHIPPLIALEFVSGDGSEERDRTPWTGKFWIYEQIIRPAFYGIHEVKSGQVEVYHLIENRYQPLPPNDRGHYPIAPLGVELGIWEGEYQNATLPWLRWWDGAGNLLLTGDEQVEPLTAALEQERQRAEQERQRAEQERQRAEQLAAYLRSIGLDPDNLPST